MNKTEDEKLSFETSEDVKVINTFDELGLKEDLLRGIYSYSMISLIIVRFCRLLTTQTLKNHPLFNSVLSTPSSEEEMSLPRRSPVLVKLQLSPSVFCRKLILQ